MHRINRYRVPRAVLRAVGALTLSLAAACSRGADSEAGDTTTATTVSASAAAPDSSAIVTVYKSPTCGCCTAWVDHMRKSGFRVVAIDTSDVDAVKRRYGVASEHASCHTATVGGYVVEGHVPAEDVRRLLAQRPSIAGLAVPGMPVGSPGMEGGFKQAYEVIAFTRGGATTVFAKH